MQILATGNGNLQTKVEQYRQDLLQMVLDKQDRLDKLGYRAYLDQM